MALALLALVIFTALAERRSIKDVLGPAELDSLLLDSSNRSSSIRGDVARFLRAFQKHGVPGDWDALAPLRHHLFKQLDVDQDGQLSLAEAQGVYLEFDFASKEVPKKMDMMFREVDMDSSQSLDEMEFLMYMTVFCKLIIGHHLESAVLEKDPRHDSPLTIPSRGMATKKFVIYLFLAYKKGRNIQAEQTCMVIERRLFRELDLDEDGQLSIVEIEQVHTVFPFSSDKLSGDMHVAFKTSDKHHSALLDQVEFVSYLQVFFQRVVEHNMGPVILTPCHDASGGEKPTSSGCMGGHQSRPAAAASPCTTAVQKLVVHLFLLNARACPEATTAALVAEQRLFKALDTDGDGRLDLGGAQGVYSGLPLAPAELAREMRAAFDSADRLRQQSLDQTEFRLYLGVFFQSVAEHDLEAALVGTIPRSPDAGRCGEGQHDDAKRPRSLDTTKYVLRRALTVKITNPDVPQIEAAFAKVNQSLFPQLDKGLLAFLGGGLGGGPSLAELQQLYPELPLGLGNASEGAGPKPPGDLRV